MTAKSERTTKSERNFSLVRWIEDDTVGVMPMSAVAASSEATPYIGAVVDMRWRGKKTYEAEILKISRNKQELNKLCTKLVNFEITIEEIQEMTVKDLKPNDSVNPACGHDKRQKTKNKKNFRRSAAGKENKPTVPTSAPTKKELDKQKQKAKNATALQQARTIFSNTLSSCSDDSDVEAESQEEYDKQETPRTNSSGALLTNVNQQKGLIQLQKSKQTQYQNHTSPSSTAALKNNSVAASSPKESTHGQPNQQSANSAYYGHTAPAMGRTESDLFPPAIGRINVAESTAVTAIPQQSRWPKHSTPDPTVADQSYTSPSSTAALKDNPVAGSSPKESTNGHPNQQVANSVHYGHTAPAMGRTESDYLFPPAIGRTNVAESTAATAIPQHSRWPMIKHSTPDLAAADQSYTSPSSTAALKNNPVAASSPKESAHGQPNHQAANSAYYGHTAPAMGRTESGYLFPANVAESAAATPEAIPAQQPSWQQSWLKHSTPGPPLRNYPSLDDSLNDTFSSEDSSCITTPIQKVQQNIVELMPGYGICCTQRQRDEAVSSSTSPGKLIRRLLPIFFSPETMATHSCSGRGKNPPLDEDVIAACIAFVQGIYKGTARTTLVDHINDKCSSYRRGQRRTKTLNNTN